MATALQTKGLAQRALQAQPALRFLNVEETNSAIVITGRVPTYYLKQLAQEAVLPLLRGRSLLNDVTVVRA
jgi:hypothetical protein